MKALAFSISMLKRDWRAGEIQLIAVAITVAVGAMSAVTFFTDRIRQSMETQGSALLAADLAVDMPDPIPESLEAKARGLHLQVAHTLSFRSMVTAGERLQLAEVKAVDAPYPLRGRLSIGERPFDRPVETDVGPAPGTVWLDTQLLQALDVSVGQEIGLGNSRLIIAKVLLFEPDRGGDLFHIAPRLMMNLYDVPATGLLLPGSRVRYRLLVAGGREDLEAYRRWVGDHLGEGARLLSVRDARPELRAALDHADQYLGLAALSSVLLAGVAIGIAARRFVIRHLDNCAVMRCLGASQRFIVRVYGLSMIGLGLMTSLIGCLVGLVAQFGLARLVTGLIAQDLPLPSMLPVLSGTLTGLIALLGFAVPPLLQLKHVPPSRVLRRDQLPDRSPVYAVYLGAIIAIVSLVSWHVGEVRLTLYVLSGSLITVMVLAGVALVLVNGLKLLRSRVGIAWRYGFTNVARRARSSVIQTVALGLGIMVMLLLTIVRTDLLANWKAKLPPEAPNHFVINIQPDEVPAIGKFFADRGIPASNLYPIIHGRLIAINGHPVDPAHYADQRAQRLAKREFHLTWMDQLQSDNRIVAGRWWSSEATDRHQFSVETGVAETLGIALGDTLTFQVVDQTISATVTSLRSVTWDTFNPNFFVIAPPGLLDHHPATYMASFFLQQDKEHLLSELIGRFPSITLLDVEALMQQVRSMMDRVALAVEFVFGFTLLSGLLVLFAATQSTHDERLYESAVLRTLGASRLTVVRGLVAEFVSLGVVAGLLAAGGATAIGYGLAEHIFETGYQFNPWLLLVGLLTGGLGISLAGVLGTRSVLHTPPIQTLRHF